MNSSLRHLPNIISIARILLVGPVVWSLLHGEFTLAIGLFLLAATGHVPAGLQFDKAVAFLASGPGKIILFFVISLALWHSAHRLRVVFHDFGVRKDKIVAPVVYLVAFAGTVLTAWYVYAIR